MRDPLIYATIVEDMLEAVRVVLVELGEKMVNTFLPVTIHNGVLCQIPSEAGIETLL